MSNNVSWLVTCPCTDGNFKCRLNQATREEIMEALEELNKTAGENAQKSKRAVLKARLKRLEAK